MWGTPPVIKIYEALGAVADGRVHVEGDTAKCYSSSGNKFYDVTYDPTENAIMTNDNGSYWVGYLGYPAIAFLLSTEVLPYQEEVAAHFKGIAWKDINQKYNNDFDKTIEHIFSTIGNKKRRAIETYAASLMEQIAALGLAKLGKRQKPPAGY